MSQNTIHTQSDGDRKTDEKFIAETCTSIQMDCQANGVVFTETVDEPMATRYRALPMNLKCVPHLSSASTEWPKINWMVCLTKENHVAEKNEHSKRLLLCKSMSTRCLIFDRWCFSCELQLASGPTCRCRKLCRAQYVSRVENRSAIKPCVCAGRTKDDSK